MIKDNNSSDQFITIQEAAEMFNKSVHNISYLVQYSRINKFYKTENEKIINAKELKKTKLRINNSPLISLNELQNYYDKIRKKEEEIINNIPNCNRDYSFLIFQKK